MEANKYCIIKDEIEDFSDYILFKTGKIFNTKKKKFIKISTDVRKKKRKDGSLRIQKYKVAYLNDGYNQHKRYHHRLLATHFIPNPENKPLIDHKDGNGLNNDLKNLDWATYSENSLNYRSQGYTLKYDESIEKWRVSWPYLENEKRKYHILHYNTKTLAQEFCNNYEFPLAKNYRGC